MNTITPGSRWQGSGPDCFQVIQTVTIEQQEWVHYRRERDGQEFSCWTDSFAVRFRSTPHDTVSASLFGFGP
jgi:hypothetical protein